MRGVVERKAFQRAPPRVYIYPSEELARGSRNLWPVPLRFLNKTQPDNRTLFLSDQGFTTMLYDGIQPFAVSVRARY